MTTCIGIQDTANCVGIHLNMPIVQPDPATMKDLTEKEKSSIAGMQYYNDWDSGYSQAAEYASSNRELWPNRFTGRANRGILEKFWAWTHCDGHPEKVLTRDELLDNVMLNWLPANAASSARLYWESFRFFGFMVVAEGWSGHPPPEAITVLDQNTSGPAPSAGLPFTRR